MPSSSNFTLTAVLSEGNNVPLVVLLNLTGIDIITRHSISIQEN